MLLRMFSEISTNSLYTWYWPWSNAATVFAPLLLAAEEVFRVSWEKSWQWESMKTPIVWYHSSD